MDCALSDIYDPTEARANIGLMGRRNRLARRIRDGGGVLALATVLLATACREPEPAAISVTATPASKATPQVSEKQPSTSLPVAIVPRAHDLDEALAEITPVRLRRHVERMADDAFRGRPTPSPELDEVADYIIKTLRQAGISAPPGAPDHRQTFACGGPRHPGPASNVFGWIPGREKPDDVVMLSAHYDHIGQAQGGTDRIFNGANDNASGVAAMLEIARTLVRLPQPLRRSVLVVAFCGEERGLLGSQHYVADPVVDLSQVVAQINLEMLGRPTPSAPNIWITGMELSTLGSILNDAMSPDGSRLTGPRPRSASPVRFVSAHTIGPVEGHTFDRSDNYPLAQAGVVAHSLSTGRIDSIYHTVHDEADLLDYGTMAVLVEAIARGVVHLAMIEDRPTWTDAATETAVRP